jgi:hypothetical protein
MQTRFTQERLLATEHDADAQHTSQYTHMHDGAKMSKNPVVTLTFCSGNDDAPTSTSYRNMHTYIIIIAATIDYYKQMNSQKIVE